METPMTTVTISNMHGTYSATVYGELDMDAMMNLIRSVLLSVGYSEENIEEYIPKS